MKNMYTKEQLLIIVKQYDVRAQKMSESELDAIVNMAYAEMCAIGISAFSNEEVIDLQPYQDVGEYKFTIDIVEDVSTIYDLYITVEEEGSGYEHGIQKIRDKEVVWKDNRYDGRVHIDLSKKANLINGADNVVLKYYFIPTTSTESVYMDGQTMLAFKYALGVALYETVHDVERSEQKRAALNRTMKALMPSLPEDATNPAYGHMFAGMEH